MIEFPYNIFKDMRIISVTTVAKSSIYGDYKVISGSLPDSGIQSLKSYEALKMKMKMKMNGRHLT